MDNFEQYINIFGLVVLIIGSLLLICSHCSGLKNILETISKFFHFSRSLPVTNTLALYQTTQGVVEAARLPVRRFLQKSNQDNLPSGAVCVTTV